ncbi:hypothetical protein, partial [Pseudomonas syringae group genomosp. 7]|uniref:hypothetical protein n=1 Tax=Pseudomonas syringae group genomosp. 7 TaxID=251699 RepID=UPI00377072E8
REIVARTQRTIQRYTAFQAVITLPDESQTAPSRKYPPITLIKKGNSRHTSNDIVLQGCK